MTIDEHMQDAHNALQPMPAKEVSEAGYDNKIKLAQLMAKATSSMPRHLHNNPGECLSIVFKALRWGMDPFSVGEKTSIINGRIMYEGQLVNAVINASGQLAQRLKYEVEGEGEDMHVTCAGLIAGENEPRTIKIGMPGPTEARNSPLWKSNPEQQLCYKAARVWCRRHMPEVLLGVYTPEDNFEDKEPTKVDLGFKQNVKMLDTSNDETLELEAEEDVFTQEAVSVSVDMDQEHDPTYGGQYNPETGEVKGQ